MVGAKTSNLLHRSDETEKRKKKGDREVSYLAHHAKVWWVLLPF